MLQPHWAFCELFFGGTWRVSIINSLWASIRSFYRLPKEHCLSSKEKYTTILSVKEILHQLIGSLSHHLQGFTDPRWLFGISSINSSSKAPTLLRINTHLFSLAPPTKKTYGSLYEELIDHLKTLRKNMQPWIYPILFLFIYVTSKVQMCPYHICGSTRNVTVTS